MSGLVVNFGLQQRSRKMSEWIDINEREPRDGRNVIAVGTWWGEVNGYGEDGYMGIGEWRPSGYVVIDSGPYSTQIMDVTHWMPIPEHPYRRTP